jgi:hypothetical protein
MQQARGITVLVEDLESEGHFDIVASNGCRFNGAVIVPKRVELGSLSFHLQKLDVSISSKIVPHAFVTKPDRSERERGCCPP